MPHVKIEYSKNLHDGIQHKPLLDRLHQEMTAVSDPNFIKLRATCHDHFRVGDGGKHRAFVHVTVSMLSGRDTELKKALGKSILSCLKETLAGTVQGVECNFSVEIEDMDREVYAKEDDVRL